MSDELAAMTDGDPWLYADLHQLEPHHRAARERTDAEQAAVDGWARSEVARHQAHGCQSDAVECVEGGPAVEDSRDELVARGWPRTGLGRLTERQAGVMDNLRAKAAKPRRTTGTP